MIDCYTHKEVNDREVWFSDCILYIIYGQDKISPAFLTCFKACLIENESMSLANISRIFPEVITLIVENALDGNVYHYNIVGGWKLVGKTKGYA